MDSKKCKKCGFDKEFSEFSPNKLGKFGLKSQCKECCNNNLKQAYKNGRKYDTLSYYYQNIKSVKKQRKQYYKNNKVKIQSYQRTWQRNKRNSDDLFKLSHNIRVLIGKSFSEKGVRKDSKTINILGCTIQEFKGYIESLWQPWMTWENYGKYNGSLNFGWDIDHIIPLGSAKTKEDLIRLNYYTNLQPLCSFNNRYQKKNNYDNTRIQ